MSRRGTTCNILPQLLRPSQLSINHSSGKRRREPQLRDGHAAKLLWEQGQSKARVPRDVIHYTDRRAGKTINKMDFIISYQSLVDNMGYFKNSIKDNSAGKRTGAAHSRAGAAMPHFH